MQSANNTRTGPEGAAIRNLETDGWRDASGPVKGRPVPPDDAWKRLRPGHAYGTQEEVMASGI